MNSDKILVFYSGYYKSSFEYGEILYLSTKFKKIVLVSNQKLDVDLPFNVELLLLDFKEYHNKSFLTLKRLLFVFKIMFKDTILRKFNLSYLKQLKSRLSLLIRNFYLSEKNSMSI